MKDARPISRRRRAVTLLLKYAIPLAVSVGLCYVLFTGIDFGEMIAIVRRDCDFTWIAAALGLSLFSYVFRALRWQLQLNALGIKAPLFVLVLSMFGTYAVNLVFPRLGEVWRSGYVARRQRAPFTEVFGSMVAERCADSVTVLLIALAAFTASSEALAVYFRENTGLITSLRSLVTSPWLWLAFVAFVAVCAALLRPSADNAFAKKVRGIVRGLWDGFAVIVKMPGKLRWLEWTCCVWGCYFTQTIITYKAFPATEAVVSEYGLSAVLVTFALSSMSMGVPSNGGIGPWQWAVILGLGIYGVGQAAAGAYANVVLGSQTLLQIILGILTFALIAADRRRNKPDSKSKNKIKT